MTHTRLVAALCAALLSLASGMASAQARPHFIEVQWPGWQAPSYLPEWDVRRERCRQMRERVREVRYHMQIAPPWERDRIGTRLYQLEERLRHECWGHWHEDDD